MKSFKRGFTLIELLVVIAIIGILAGIVLTSLGSARGKANDAKIKGQLSSMRAAMEMYYTTNSNYGATVAAATAITNGCSATPSAAPWNDSGSGLLNLSDTDNYPSGASPSCLTEGGAWAAEATLSTTNDRFCVDSKGAAVSYNSATSRIAGGASAHDLDCSS